MDSLRQHCLRANYLAYLVHHPSLKDHPSPLGHDWELACRAVCHTRPTLPTQLPEPELSEDCGEDEKIMMTRKTVMCDDSSESSGMDSIDSTSDAEC